MMGWAPTSVSFEVLIIVGRRTQSGGNLQYHCLWRSQDATELEWLDEADVPTYLAEEFEGCTDGATLAVGV